MGNLEAKVTKDCTFRPTVLKKKKKIDLNAFAVPSYEVVNQSLGFYGGNSLQVPMNQDLLSSGGRMRL